MDEQELRHVLEELEQYRKEKETLKKILGSVGGQLTGRKEEIFNWIFALALLSLFTMDLMRHYLHIKTPVPGELSLEIGVFLVSCKIIWMLHLQTRLAHFQFWILNTMEFRLNTIQKTVNELKNRADSRG